MAGMDARETTAPPGHRGKYDLSFDPGEPERYRKDVPTPKSMFSTPVILRWTRQRMKSPRWFETFLVLRVERSQVLRKVR